MTYNLRSYLHSDRAFFRSTAAVTTAGLFSGGSVIATALDNSHLELRAALAALISAAAVALADYVARQRSERKRREFVEAQHAETRRVVTRTRRRKAAARKVQP